MRLKISETVTLSLCTQHIFTERLITASRRILTALRDHLKNKLDRLTGDGPDED